LKEQDKKGSTQTKDSEVVQTKEDEPDFQPPQDMDIERLAEPGMIINYIIHFTTSDM